MSTTMQVSLYTEYGSPEVLQFKAITKPTPKDNEILVRIYATTVSAVDCHFRKGSPYSTRLMNGFTKPRFQVLGGSLAGQVEAVGKDVTLFKVGDRVFGGTSTLGTHAEYMTVPEDGVLAHIPADFSYEEIIALPDALTPLHFLREIAQIEPGQTVLINGAAGGIGSFAVQLAKHFGATVTAVCRSQNHELVRSLGADTVIDYTQEDFTEARAAYDVIFDTVAKSSFSRCKDALKPNGIYMTTDVSWAILGQMLWTKLFSRKKAVVGFAGLNMHKKDLVFVKELAEAGKIKGIIGRSYPMTKMVEAHRYVETGHKRGTAVITI